MMDSLLVLIPVVLPLITAALLLPLTGRARLQQAAALVSGGVLLASAMLLCARTARGAILVLPLGGWSPRVGIVWVADALAAVMLLFVAIVSYTTLLYAGGSLRGERERRYFYPLHQFLLVGVGGSILTGDLFNLFVFFEVMLLASFALIALGGRARQVRMGVPYVIVNLVGSALFLAAVGAMYGAAGTVNMAELSLRAGGGGLPGVFWGATALVLVVFMVKTALFPVFAWLPDSYPEAPVTVNALFAGLLTKVGVYTLFRTIPLLGGAAPGGWQPALVAIAATTMLVGVLGALGRSTIRGVLSFHIVSQVGYMIFGLALFTPLALAAGLFHTLHNMVAKTALVFAGGVAERIGGSGKLYAMRGLARTEPWLAAGFFVAAMSLAGMPPLSGFWGKWFLVAGGLAAGAPVATGISLLVGLFTLASMLKIWNAVFWGEPEGQRYPGRGQHRGMLGATLSLAAMTLLTGLLAAPIFSHLERVATQLLDVTPYVAAVRAAERREVHAVAP
ncbi:proton-conducting transporter transmembrane domain-containing protein [Polyangium mundeleinium]|uniref:Proton-conducting transporter membrane subunit n=1 Tax=Polyangium mundeleinium TaxID=2995306 RepID=A0ABT5EXL5_9BACT|nr:proton-conducting transporter membrane subunit [Polyangium mundeleinium]MDC0746567.1 proton-conducting transporter membrane subunit [Polyangium mundeleinium]